jgi:hypothetical protein
MTNKHLKEVLERFPDNAEIYFHPIDGKDLISMDSPTFLRNSEFDGSRGLKAVIFYCDYKDEAVKIDYNRACYGS